MHGYNDSTSVVGLVVDTVYFVLFAIIIDLIVFIKDSVDVHASGST
jgi:hypothetical protein